jgi:nitrite reductase/ring-hydroxylating ferredoxin subunit
MSEFVTVAKTSEIAPDNGKLVEVQGKRIALFNVGGAFYAIDNACRHRGASLADGFIAGDSVQCPRHGWQYNLKTGVPSVNPALKSQTYEVKVEGEDVQIKV